MVVGDKRKYLTCFVTLKVWMGFGGYDWGCICGIEGGVGVKCGV